MELRRRAMVATNFMAAENTDRALLRKSFPPPLTGEVLSERSDAKWRGHRAQVPGSLRSPPPP